VEGPTTKNVRHCLVGLIARGTKSWPETEEQRNNPVSGIFEPDARLQSWQRCAGHYREGISRITRLEQLSYKKYAVQLEANAACQHISK